MTGKGTTKTLRTRRDHSLAPIRWYHPCSDCEHFFKEFLDEEGLHKNYCVKHLRRVLPDGKTCCRFLLRLSKQGKCETYECLAHIWTGTKHVKRDEPESLLIKEARCPWCRREFSYREYHPNYVRKYCSKGCRWRFIRFKKKSEKNARVFRNYS